jgi:hypothetical protein
VWLTPTNGPDLIQFRRISMTKFTFGTAALAVLALGAASTATFATDVDAPQGGHYEWRQVPQHGPKAPLTAPQRVWVSDTTRMANCNCGMMKMSAADCMMDMHKPQAPSAG